MSTMRTRSNPYHNCSDSYSLWDHRVFFVIKQSGISFSGRKNEDSEKYLKQLELLVRGTRIHQEGLVRNVWITLKDETYEWYLTIRDNLIGDYPYAKFLDYFRLFYPPPNLKLSNDDEQHEDENITQYFLRLCSTMELLGYSEEEKIDYIHKKLHCKFLLRPRAIYKNKLEIFKAMKEYEEASRVEK